MLLQAALTTFERLGAKLDEARAGELLGRVESPRTFLFTDIVDSTARAANVGDSRWRDQLRAHDTALRREIDRFGGREVKTIGDSFLVTFDAPSHGLRCAQAMVAAVEPLGLQIRCGLHTGECEIMGDDVGGMAVHIASRVAGLARPGEVLASGTAFGSVRRRKTAGSQASVIWATSAASTACGSSGLIQPPVSVVSLLPPKGLTLPLMSYGASSIMVTLGWLGVLLRIHHEASAAGRLAVPRRERAQ